MNKISIKRYCETVFLGLLILTGCILHTRYKIHTIFWIMIGILCLVLAYAAFEQSCEKRTNHCALILGVLFGTAVVVGQDLHVLGTIERLIDPNHLPKTFMQLAGMCGMSWAIMRILLCKLQKYGVKEEKERRASFLVLWIMVFVCWLPYFISFFPGILTNDSITELKIILGQLPLANHHPIIHQWTIAPFVNLGKMFGSIQWGVGLYSLFQMTVMSAITAGVLYYTAKMNIASWISALLFAFYALFTLNAFYSISMWKDVLFGGFTLLVMIMLVHLTRSRKVKRIFWPMLGIVLFLFCTYRNNGYYAFLISVPFLIAGNRRIWKQLLVVSAAVVIGVSTYHSFLFDVMGAEKSKTAEMLSVPLQQIARTLYYDRDGITDEERMIIEEVLPSVGEVRADYIPHISDPVKEDFRSDVFDQNPMRYAKLWIDLGLRHPLIYLDAFLYQCHGYWYPDTPYWCVDTGILDNELGLTMRNSAVAELIRELETKLEQIPIVSTMYRPATYIWLLMFAAALLVCKKKKRLLTPMVILAGIWLTTLLSPVFAEYRYVYGIVLSAPFFLVVAVNENSCDNQEEKRNDKARPLLKDEDMI